MSESPRPPTPTRAQLAARRQYRRALKRSRNPLAIPCRWLLMMLIAVALLAAGAAALALRLRHASPIAPGTASVEIVTAARMESPMPRSASPESGDHGSPAQVILAPSQPASLALTGPPVPTVIVTDTPIPLAVGLKAEVANVGSDELNVRSQPTTRGSQILFRAPAGTVFDIIGGPRHADGYSWWQLHDPAIAVSGWAVARYLNALPESSGQES